MDFQSLYNTASQYIVAAVAASGGVVAVAYGAFKVFSSKWLESKFAEQLQRLKAEQDQAIRHVQSTIDREIHRAKKLYDSEFTALSECWGLLRKAFDQSAATVASFTVQVDRMNDEELERHLVKREMEEWERREMKSLTGRERQDAYYRWSEWQRLKMIEKLEHDFRAHLDANSIFFAAGFTEKFRELDDMITSANIEFRMRIEDYGLEVRSAGRYQAVEKLMGDGRSKMNELEALVRSRLWAVAKDGVPEPRMQEGGAAAK